MRCSQLRRPFISRRRGGLGSGGNAEFGEDPEVGERDMSRQPRKGQGRTEIKDMFERLRLDPESRMLGQLIQERQRATSRDLVVKQRTFLITTRMTALP